MDVVRNTVNGLIEQFEFVKNGWEDKLSNLDAAIEHEVTEILDHKPGARKLLKTNEKFAAFMDRTKNSIRENRQRTIKETIKRLNSGIKKLREEDELE